MDNYLDRLRFNIGMIVLTINTILLWIRNDLTSFYEMTRRTAQKQLADPSFSNPTHIPSNINIPQIL